MQILGNRIRELREESNLTMNQLAEKIGVSNASICKWENQISEPKATYLQRLAEFFHKSTDYLLGTEEYYAAAPALADDERELLRLFRALPPEYQELALTNLRTWTGEGKHSQKKKA